MELKECLAVAGAQRSGSAPIQAPDAAEIDEILALAGAVAHASERKAAPVAAYALGLAWSSLDRDERLRLLRSATAAIDAAATGQAGAEAGGS